MAIEGKFHQARNSLVTKYNSYMVLQAHMFLIFDTNTVVLH